MLKDNEQKLLKELVKVFELFDKLITYFSKIQYTTLSVINSSIKTLKFEFANEAILVQNEFEEIINNNNLKFDINESKYNINL